MVILLALLLPKQVFRSIAGDLHPQRVGLESCYATLKLRVKIEQSA